MRKATRKNRGHPLGKKMLCIMLTAGMLFTSAVSDTVYANDIEPPLDTVEQIENIDNENSESGLNTEVDEMTQNKNAIQDIQTQDMQTEEDKSNHDDEAMTTVNSVQSSVTMTNIGQTTNMTVSNVDGEYDYYSSNKPYYARIVTFIPSYTDTYYISSVSSFDTYGRLYDENMNSLTYDDDSAGSSQFRLTYKCEAGKTYYITAGGYSNSSSSRTLAVKIETSN